MPIEHCSPGEVLRAASRQRDTKKILYSMVCCSLKCRICRFLGPDEPALSWPSMVFRENHFHETVTGSSVAVAAGLASQAPSRFTRSDFVFRPAWH